METINVSALIFKALTLMAKRKEVSIEELTNEILTQGIKARVEVPEYITYEDEENNHVHEDDPEEDEEFIQSLLDGEEETALGISYTHEEAWDIVRKFMGNYNEERASA